MRNLILGAVGAAVIALATPAVAQVHVDVPGVGVRVGDGQHNNRQHNRGYRARAQADCREVTTRTVRPNGTVVVKKSTRC
jgi:hypothetical protein